MPVPPGDRDAGARSAPVDLLPNIMSWQVAVLFPGHNGTNATVPVTAAEQPGMGKALGGAVGAAAGAASGFELGAVLSAVVPGVGPVLVAGFLGATPLGVAGAAVGGKLDNFLSEGVPEDELYLYLYEDALRQGRSVVLALGDDEASET